MKAKLIIKTRLILSENSFAEMVIWQVPDPVRGSKHTFKYRLAFVVNNKCVLRYDNEPGKGDHKHLATVEMPYNFITPKQLMADFWNDVDNWEDVL